VTVPVAQGSPARTGIFGCGRSGWFGSKCGLVIEMPDPRFSARAAMRTVLRSVTRVPVIAAIAEALPVVNSTLVCVCVAQAFHRLHSAQAIPELHRVLVSGGHLALVWNLHKSTEPLNQAMDRIIGCYVDRGSLAAVFGDSRAALGSTSRFDAVKSRSFEHPHRLPANALADLLLTSSDVASLPAELRRAVAQEIDGLAATLPSEVVIRSVTRVEVYRRRSSDTVREGG